MDETIEIIQNGEYQSENPITMEDESTMAEILEVAAEEMVG